jgi:virginiamycin B lyase
MGGIEAPEIVDSDRSSTFVPQIEYVTPDNIAAGPDGNVWTTDLDLSYLLSFFDPAGLPGLFSLDSSISYSLGGLVTGPDHAIWIANMNGFIHRVDPTIPGGLASYSILGGQPAYIAVGPDGALWFTDPGRDVIGRITTAGATSSFPIPTPASGPQGIAAGPDANLWFTESDANQIGRITPAGTVTEFAVATGKSAPQQIVVGPDGALWFTERDADQIGRITTAGVVSERPIPTPGSKPVGIAAGPDSAVWFTETAGHAIGRMTMDGAVIEFPVGSSRNDPFGIAVGPDGDLWYTLPDLPSYSPGGSVGRLTPESKPLCVLSIPQINLYCDGGPSQTVTIANVGGSSCGTLSVTLDASNPVFAAFQLSSTCTGASLDPGASCTITVSVPNPTSDQINSQLDYEIILKLQPQFGEPYEPQVSFRSCI